jgi:carbonic anhydrase
MSDDHDRIYGEFAPSNPRVAPIDQFGTILECMDGRPQRKVADYLSTSFGVRNLDNITTAGLVRHLAEDTDQTSTILDNLDISIQQHGSRKVAVVAHHDCAGNPVSDKTQKQQIVAAVARLESLYPDVEVTGLWINENWIVERVQRA